MLRRSEILVFLVREGLKVIEFGPNNASLDKLPSSPTGGAEKQFGLT